jgi:hypothetical protein
MTLKYMMKTHENKDISKKDLDYRSVYCLLKLHDAAWGGHGPVLLRPRHIATLVLVGRHLTSALNH